MFAKIIVGLNTPQVDRVFDYEIPNEWEEFCKVGVRVMVPFGRRNTKMEGYILSLSSESKISKGKIKSIIEVLDNGQIMFTPVMIFLAKFMQKKYFCTLNQCFQVSMPSGIKTKSVWLIKLKGEPDSAILDDTHREMITLLSKYPYGIELKEIEKQWGMGYEQIVAKLEKQGLVYRYQKVWRGEYKKEKTVYFFQKDAFNLKEVQEKAEKEKRLEGQRQIFQLFQNRAEISLDEIKKENISLSALKTLVKKGILLEKKIEERRQVFHENKYAPSIPFLPTQEQQSALNQIYSIMEQKEKKPVLIHGVTGSGKTEIYLQSIDRVLSQGKQAIILVPEISLTPQMMERFISRFGKKVSITHSRLSQGERLDQWKKARDGEISIMIGPRSALFMPFENLGMVIIDEVHETTYVSDTTPKYDAREVAMALVKETNAVLVMGSATPDVEMYYKALEGDYHLIELKNKAGGGQFSQMCLIDMRKELEEGNRSPFSVQLQQSLRETLKKGEQSMLFLNRRGYATFVSCRSCGHVMECPDCKLPYTYHAYQKELLCHHCGRGEQNPAICPVCSSKYIRYFGTGTQKIEEEARRLFPEARILRMDFDTTSGKHGHGRILEQFQKGQADILIGTQMIAKGHDFPNVTLMGIMAADTSLYTPSFYAAETTFQLITQGSGRAGRSAKGGKVYIQTYQPDHYAVVHGKNQDYIGFYKEEISIRKLMGYPPFGIFFSILVSGKEDIKAESWANKLVEHMESESHEFMIMGPVATMQKKLNEEYRYRILLQGTEEESLVAFILEHMDKIKKGIENDIYFNLTLNPRYIV